MTLVTVMLLILHICTFMETRREIKQEEKNMEEEEIMDEYEDNDELDDKELIIIVKANPFLCNKSEKLYSNIEIKKLAWTAIGERLSKKRLVSIYTIYLLGLRSKTSSPRKILFDIRIL